MSLHRDSHFWQPRDRSKSDAGFVARVEPLPRGSLILAIVERCRAECEGASGSSFGLARDILVLVGEREAAIDVEEPSTFPNPRSVRFQIEEARQAIRARGIDAAPALVLGGKGDGGLEVFVDNLLPV